MRIIFYIEEEVRTAALSDLKNSNMNLVQKIQQTIQCYQLVKKTDTVVVAVSGGPDSVALLHVLFSLKYELGIQLHVAHFNHGLRRSAGIDEKFVVQLAKRLNLPCTTISLPFTRKIKAKGSIEEWAREVRFDFLMKVAREKKAAAIALGHTQDDLAETVMMRVLRGTGLQGLRSILPKREMNGYCFIRPLLEVRRREIESFLKEKKLRFRVDSSNRKTKFFRNKIRLNLFPLLEKKYNANIQEILAHLAYSAAYDYEYLELQGDILLKQIAKLSPSRSSISIGLKDFPKIHRSLKNMLIRLAIEKIKGDTNRLTFTHIREIEDLLITRPIGAVVHLPDEITVVKDRKYLRLTAFKKNLNK